MLTTYLKGLPYTKFVLIEDSVASKGCDLLQHLTENHKKNQQYRTHLFIFEKNFNAVKNTHSDSVCHDFTTDLRNWMTNNAHDLKTAISNLDGDCVIVVDSLVHVLYRYGLPHTYEIFTQMKNKSNIHQIVTVLHTDLLEDKDKVVQYFQHLATLHLELDTKRVSYTYKKNHRKVIKQVEEYHFENGKFITEVIKRGDINVIRGNVQISPANMSTFKISLSQKDKESRDNLILPYLPKENAGDIQYTFDNIDDWDEEDPDDDLDI